METVHSAEFDSPIGTLRIASTERRPRLSGSARLRRTRFRGLARAGARRAHGARPPSHRTAKRSARSSSTSTSKRTDFDLPLDLRGTPFQNQVWNALLEIPYGVTRSYAEIARAVRNPAAVRAVGAANGSNPVALVVPCHRVIASGGKLGGYGGGLDLKRRLLAMEQSVRHQGSLL